MVNDRFYVSFYSKLTFKTPALHSEVSDNTPYSKEAGSDNKPAYLARPFTYSIIISFQVWAVILSNCPDHVDGVCC